jgi:hypothetical protein
VNTPFEDFPAPPRKIVMLPNGIAGRVALWLLFAALAIGVPYGMNRSVARLETLRTSGKTVQARLLSNRVQRGKSTTYFFTIAIDDPRMPNPVDQQVLPGIYYQYAGAPTVPIITMPDDPTNFEVGWIDEWHIDFARRQWLVPGGLWVLILLFFVVIFEASAYSERNLLRAGEVTTGRVVSISSGKGAQLRYQYETSLGTRDGKVSMSGPITKAGLSPESQIQILYSLSNDRKSIPVVAISLYQLA